MIIPILTIEKSWLTEVRSYIFNTMWGWDLNLDLIPNPVFNNHDLLSLIIATRQVNELDYLSDPRVYFLFQKTFSCNIGFWGLILFFCLNQAQTWIIKNKCNQGESNSCQSDFLGKDKFQNWLHHEFVV